MIIPRRVIKFATKCRDFNRQYENNNNADLDNGVYNNIDLDQKDQEEEKKSESNSADSLERSFKDTELSSDDEKANL